MIATQHRMGTRLVLAASVLGALAFARISASVHGGVGGGDVAKACDCQAVGAGRGAEQEVVELQKVFVAEAGWAAPRSHVGMAHVLHRYATAHAITIERAADLLVWPFSNAQADRPWIRYLRMDCSEPDGYPMRWSEEARGLCLRVVARARAFLRGELPDPCRGLANGWRSHGKALRVALRKGCERVRCDGGTSVAFVRCL